MSGTPTATTLLHAGILTKDTMNYSSAIPRLLILVSCFPVGKLTQQSAVWAQEKAGLAQHASPIASGNTVIITYPDGMRETRTGNRSQRGNNPGNIQYGSFARDHGAIGSDKGFAIFPSAKEDDEAALDALLRDDRFSDVRVDEASGKTCLAYEPAVVRLNGIIIRRTFPGPPNYESIKRGDVPETYWLLVLPRPVCVKQSDPANLINETKRGIRRIQLVFEDERAYDKYRRLLGKRVVATGTLYGSSTGHHKTPVLLWVNALVEAKRHR